MDNRKKYIDIYQDKNPRKGMPSRDGMIKNYSQAFYPLFTQAYNQRMQRGARGNGSSKWNPLLLLQDKVILDIGCGDGRFCYDAVYKYEAKKAYGLDIASVAVGATERYKTEKLKFFDSDASKIPLPDNSVDILTSFQVMEHFPLAKIDQIFQEFYRVTRQGWIFAISHQNNKKIHGCDEPSSWWRKKILDYADDYFLYSPVKGDYKWGSGGDVGVSRRI